MRLEPAIQDNVVPLRSGGISPALLKTLVEKGKRYGLEEVIPLSTSDIVVAQWVHLKCRYGCSRYNSNWCCPPATPGPGAVRVYLKEYSQALLLVSTQACPDFYLDNERKRTMHVRHWKATLTLERMLFLEGYYKAFGLLGETCPLCKECAYPGDCRFPQYRRPSVEAFSIDVIDTVRHVGRQVKLARNLGEPFSYYGMILLQ